MTHYPALRITTIASLIFVCATTTSAASVAKHLAKNAHHSASAISSYSVSTTFVNRPLDVARQADGPSVVASADDFYNNTKFDDLHGTSNVKRDNVRITTQYITSRHQLALEPEVRLTPLLAPGQRKVLRSGHPALEDLTERIVAWDDVVIHRQIIHANLLHQGVRPIVLQGAPLTWTQLASTTKFKHLLGVFDMEATAYTAWDVSAAGTGHTATGIPASYGVVAVDPRIIRLGSRVFIPGYGLAIAADTGGAIVGRRIDLCMDSQRAALIFGRRFVKVYVVAE
ncbi:MAG TPA: 3D domain-containing protein [Candidatus Binatus sp.]|nr:3D domain-containing protein [Candidatus Binatus sp.]